MVIDIYVAILLGIFALIIFFFFLSLYHAFMQRHLIKKYKEENDKSREGEIRRREELELESGKRTIINRKPVVEGLDKSQGGELLQTTAVDNDGKDDTSTGKTSKSSGGFFGLLKRRRK